MNFYWRDIVLSIMSGVLFGSLLGYSIRKYIARLKANSAEEQAKRITENATRDAEAKKREAALEAKDTFHKERGRFEKETRERRVKLESLERRQIERQENLDRKVDLLDKKERTILSRVKGISDKEEDLARSLEKQKRELERISRLTTEEAKKNLMATLEEEVKQEAALMIKEAEERARETAQRKAKLIISLAIQKCAVEHTSETTVSVVPLPNDEMKGRIIGREGRNIRALEAATGIDLIVDDTPEAVTLSGFDPVRREIARISLEKLIEDGRIHPGRIEEVVKKIRKEMEGTLREIGEQLVLELRIPGIHPEIVKLLGRLKYRTSYGQNVLQHTKEVYWLGEVMARELKGNADVVKRAALLHDIGKAVDHEVEGSHVEIGINLARKYGESGEVIHAIASHHEDEEPRTIEAIIVQTADAVSASRPGARRESLEGYIKRLEKLEKIADSFKGVEKAYAIQAGREIRIIVKPEELSDNASAQLARDVAKKIEEGLEYPGQVKVTVIRELRAVDYAK